MGDRMRSSRLRSWVLIAAVLLTLSVPAVSSAYIILCDGSYDVIICNNGSKWTCWENNFAYQVDCLAEEGPSVCANDNGFADIGHPNGEIADYQGLLQLAPYTGRGEVNSTARTMLTAVCSDGRSFTCDDKKVSCPASFAELQDRCGPSGELTSVVGHVGFVPMSVRRR